MFGEFLAPVLLAVFTVVFIISVVFGINTIFNSKECKVWGGEYSIAAGCLVKYNGKTLTLNQYKNISAIEITQPIEHNVIIKSK